jgi:hypothetical protein
VVDLEGADRQAGPAAVVGSVGRAGAGELQVRPDLGDAGALLDATAKAAYRARLAELEAELAAAEGFHDPERATKARQEMDFLVGSWPGRSAWGSGPAGGRPCRAGPAECDQGDPGGDGQPGPGPPLPGAASGRHRPGGSVLRLHPRPTGPDRLAALTGGVLRRPD